MQGDMGSILGGEDPTGGEWHPTPIYSLKSHGQEALQWATVCGSQKSQAWLKWWTWINICRTNAMQWSFKKFLMLLWIRKIQMKRHPKQQPKQATFTLSEPPSWFEVADSFLIIPSLPKHWTLVKRLSEEHPFCLCFPSEELKCLD